MFSLGLIRCLGHLKELSFSFQVKYKRSTVACMQFQLLGSPGPEDLLSPLVGDQAGLF